MKEVKYKQKSCGECGVQFIPKYPAQVFCSKECYTKNKQRLDRERIADKRGKENIKVPQEQKSKPLTQKQRLGSYDAERPFIRAPSELEALHAMGDAQAVDADGETYQKKTIPNEDIRERNESDSILFPSWERKANHAIVNRKKELAAHIKQKVEEGMSGDEAFRDWKKKQRRQRQKEIDEDYMVIDVNKANGITEWCETEAKKKWRKEHPYDYAFFFSRRNSIGDMSVYIVGRI